ncbi:MAG: dienelactone hydrolase family protein [Betaproteobacteria bacterium]
MTIHIPESFSLGAGRVFSPGPPQAITAELRFPPGAGPFPAVVLAHGCNGNRNTERAWGAQLREWGYATLVLDSFTGRGIQEVCTGAARLAPLQRVPDAYGALRLLARHPRVDTNRVALMGFSHGGALTMLAATAWARERYAPAGEPAFRGFIPFYPNCGPEFPERYRVSAPVRIHTGEADDWTPAGPCVALVAQLKAAGQDAEMRVYPGAHHAFDQARGHHFLPKVRNGSKCAPKVASILGPVLVDARNRDCVTRGATVAESAEAAAVARVEVRRQLGEMLARR